MALGIPLPGNGGEALQRGVEHGAGMFSNLLGQGIQRQQLGQSWQQHLHNLALQQQQEQRMQALQPYLIGQYQQASELHPWQIKNLMAQIAEHQSKAEDLAFQQNLLKQLMQGQGMQGQSEPGGMPPEQANPSRGFMMPGVQNGPSMGNIAPPSQQEIQNGFANLNPIAAQLLKKKTGIDVNAESPAQKQAREFEGFKQKEAFKAQNKQNVDKSIPTTANLTKAQNIVVSSDNLLPDLRKLKSLAAPGYKGVFSPNDYATYQDTVTGALDNMLGAYGLRSTDQNTASMLHKLERRFGEKDKHYANRIQDTIDDVLARQKAANDLIKTNKVEISPREHKHMQGEPSHPEVSLRGIINGKEVSVHPSRRKQFEEAGGIIQ